MVACRGCRRSSWTSVMLRQSLISILHLHGFLGRIARPCKWTRSKYEWKIFAHYLIDPNLEIDMPYMAWNTLAHNHPRIYVQWYAQLFIQGSVSLESGMASFRLHSLQLPTGDEDFDALSLSIFILILWPFFCITVFFFLAVFNNNALSFQFLPKLNLLPPPMGTASAATSRPWTLDLYTSLCCRCLDDAFS